MNLYLISLQVWACLLDRSVIYKPVELNSWRKTVLWSQTRQPQEVGSRSTVRCLARKNPKPRVLKQPFLLPQHSDAIFSPSLQIQLHNSVFDGSTGTLANFCRTPCVHPHVGVWPGHQFPWRHRSLLFRLRKRQFHVPMLERRQMHPGEVQVRRGQALRRQLRREPVRTGGLRREALLLV